MEPGRGRRPARQARPARLRAVEGLEEGEPSRRPRPGPRRGAPAGPGWHIECSAMAGKYLGGAFDIHGGGVDLRFPHHENEQAQSRAAGHPFASYWLHNAWITTAGEKMSKSLGNSLLIPAVLERVRGIELRYYMVAAHYRSHVEFSFEALDEAAAGFRRIEGFLERAATGRRPSAGARHRCPAAFVAAMDDDLGTPAAIGGPPRRRPRGQPAAGRRRRRRCRAGGRRRCGAMLGVLGLDPADPALGPRHRRRGREAVRRRRRARDRPARAAGRRPGPPRTSRPPTRSATGSRPPASRSRTPPTGPKWSRV